METSPVKLSCAIITFNEEKNIESCIRSVHDWVSEVVVLDSLSTDKTKDICLSFSKVKFFTNPFRGHIEQKNLAIEHCTGDWILSLDADERIEASLAQDIQSKLFASRPEALPEAYLINRLTFHMGRFIRHSGWYPQYRIRLFQKNKAIWTGENPHDYLQLVSQKSNRHLTPLKGNILHYSFQDLTHQVDTVNKFSSIVAHTRNQKGMRFSLFKVLTKPFIKFWEVYLFKAGFMDGFPGFTIAMASAFSTFLKFAKLYDYDYNGLERPSNLRKDYGK